MAVAARGDLCSGIYHYVGGPVLSRFPGCVSISPFFKKDENYIVDNFRYITTGTTTLHDTHNPRPSYTLT